MGLFSKVEATINKYDLIKKKEKIVIGVSGGPDSIAVAHILKQLQEKYDLELHIAHLDHQLRGVESKSDARFVNEFASEFNIPITIKECDVKQYQQENNLSLENAARQVRYNFFYELIDRLGFDKLAVGHHVNDQAETIIMNFLRGAGLKGLGGIKPYNNKVIRPLIEVEKNKIKQYCIENNLSWRVDRTNQEEICLRNKIRLSLLPRLRTEYNDNLIKNLKQMAEVFRVEDDFMTEQTKQFFSKIVISKAENKLIIDHQKFLELDLAIQRRMIRLLFKKLTGTYKDLYFNNIQEVLDVIAQNKTGIEIDLPEGIIVRFNYGQIIFMLAKENEEVDFFSYQLTVGEQLEMPELGLVINSEVIANDYPWQQEVAETEKSFFDLEQVGKEFYVRQRKKGDSFQPLGMSGTKKVKDFLIDEKIPLFKRDQIPVFTTAKQNIFYLGKLRIDDKYKVTNQTENILMIEIIELEED
ncbi:MAG: tRNA lysidine(34) synthetase TilS [Bacillota bacterium]